MRRTQEQVIAALAQLELNRGNIKGTAVQVGVTRVTLRKWRDGALAAEPDYPLVATGLSTVSTEKRDYAGMWGQVQVVAAEAAMAMVPKLTEATAENLRALTTLGGVASDKHLDHSLGRKGAMVNVDASTNIHADQLIAAIIQRGPPG